MSKSKDKKDDILQASVKLFGEFGLKGTSVRMIADEAGANVASIAYYFGSKENLYLDVAKYISVQIDEYMSESKNQMYDILSRDKLDKQEALQIVQGVIKSMAEMFFASEQPKLWSRIIIREQSNPTDAFDIIYLSVIQPIQDILSKAAGIYLNKPSNCDEVKIRIHALMGQVLSFLLCRESLLRHLSVERLHESHINEILSVLNIQVEGALSNS